LLKKLIKYNFKTQYAFFVILFAASIIVPIIVYILTPNANTDGIEYTWRALFGAVGPAAVILGMIIYSVMNLSDNFGGNGGYLLFTIPAKFRTHFFAKVIVFYVWFVLAIVFAVICSCLVNMEFRALSEGAADIAESFSTIIGTNPDTNYPDVRIYTVVNMIVFLFVPLVVFSLISSTIAFGHLFGQRKKLGKILFIIGLIVAVTVFLIFHTLNYNYFLERAWMLPKPFTPDGVTIIKFILDVLFYFAVIVAFILFTNRVFTKKLNVL
jgi:hypothetical protein